MADWMDRSPALPSFQDFVRQSGAEVYAAPSPAELDNSLEESVQYPSFVTLPAEEARDQSRPEDSSGRLAGDWSSVMDFGKRDSRIGIRRMKVLKLQDCVVGLPESVVQAVPQQFRSGMVMMKKRRARKYKNAVPSSFCHHCARKSPSSYVTCSNNKRRTCLKIVCKGCFDREGWDFAEATDPSREWICFHCRGICPERALCSSYDKANRKRNLENHIRKFRELNVPTP